MYAVIVILWQPRLIDAVLYGTDIGTGKNAVYYVA